MVLRAVTEAKVEFHGIFCCIDYSHAEPMRAKGGIRRLYFAFEKVLFSENFLFMPTH